MNIFDIIKKSWIEELNNQCPTVLIINDLFGGKIMNFKVDSINHYYNIIDDKIIDLTSNLNINKGKEISRESLLQNKAIKDDYYQLLNSVYNILSMQMFMTINSDEIIDRKALNQVAFFSTFEIDSYYECDDYEKVVFDLAAQNTGNIYSYKYYKKSGIYELDKEPALFTAVTKNYNIPTQVLDQIFTVARNKKQDFKIIDVLIKKLNSKENI